MVFQGYNSCRKPFVLVLLQTIPLVTTQITGAEVVKDELNSYPSDEGLFLFNVSNGKATLSVFDYEYVFVTQSDLREVFDNVLSNSEYKEFENLLISMQSQILNMYANARNDFQCTTDQRLSYDVIQYVTYQRLSSDVMNDFQYTTDQSQLIKRCLQEVFDFGSPGKIVYDSATRKGPNCNEKPIIRCLPGKKRWFKQSNGECNQEFRVCDSEGFETEEKCRRSCK